MLPYPTKKSYDSIDLNDCFHSTKQYKNIISFAQKISYCGWKQFYVYGSTKKVMLPCIQKNAFIKHVAIYKETHPKNIIIN